MKVIVCIIASNDIIYDKFKEVWIKCINYIKNTDVGNYYDFFFIYSHSYSRIDSNIIDEFTLNNHDNYIDYTYNFYDTDSNREIVVLNKIISFYKYLKLKLKLDNNESYNYHTNDNTTYILRTNLSSYFDFIKMFNFLLDKPKKCFLAGTINGFYNNISTTISGMNTILTLDLIMYIVDNSNNLIKYLDILKYEDDTMSNFIIINLNVYLINIKRLDFVEMDKVILPSHTWPSTPKSIIYQKCKVRDDTLFSFRFKTFDRQNDIEIMNLLNENIIYPNFNLNEFVKSTSEKFRYLISSESPMYDELYSRKPFKIINLI